MIKVNWYPNKWAHYDYKIVEKRIISLLDKYHVDKAQLDISLVDKKKIAKLNQQFLNRSGPTDVLSFPHHTSEDRNDIPVPPGELNYLGEIVVCAPIVEEQAKDSGNSVHDQLSFYIEHGLMHLLGYHHH